MSILVRPARTVLISSIVLTLALPAAAKTPVATGTGGAVATISEPASQAAIAILNKGGNAVDAAVAAAATLGVTDPFSCGIGGGGFMVIYLAKDKRVVTIDHRETAPASFTPSVFLKDGKEMDFDTVVASGRSVGVPGTVRGWHEALDRYGSMSFKQVLAPAIDVASKGFKVNDNFNHLVQENEAKFAQFPATAALYLRNGKAIPAGSTLRNPDLAKAYRALAAGGAKAFYSGPMARAMVDAVNANSGSMTLADLANYEARLRQPVHSTYRGYDLYGMPLPSSGGVAVAEALNILEGYDLKSLPRAKAEHLYLEASRLAFADRNAYLADPEFVDAPVAGLLNKDYAARRRELINPEQASAHAPAGDPYPFQNDVSVPLRPNANKLIAEGAHTTHLTVSDKDGNIVSYTYTIESWGGSGIVVPGYGFLLNNEMTDFDFSGPAPNVPEAGKRPRSSMSPTIAFKNGKPAFSIGSPGGATIITTVLQTIFNYVDLGMSMPDAVNAPRLSERNGMETDVEPGFIGSTQAQALEKTGQHWSKKPEEIGAANALVFNPDGTVTAVSEGHRHGVGSALVQKSAH
ncbi:gamma-glutamyltranspeptidase / glutathione hydrolase [Duganella sp. CF402]|uniref:gamma-glutamyltransferase n=1 Tax=unclassified Duganella TaxID=2636909 RepID=UPI0008C705D0|nr:MULTISPECIES: gamma-glutamyltransferase [unclassified Duganella]RZT04030.1 gamma-glutamyltranspeptidase/glutathione hydrolase [Duganella sp. BK701]SEM50801.1 gamma-glutamyltranspeptidase / glutathione hydrolase [Duganella sp. CF402]